MTYQRRQPPNLLKQQLKLSSLIIPEYYAAHTAIWSGEYNEYLGDGRARLSQIDVCRHRGGAAGDAGAEHPRGRPAQGGQHPRHQCLAGVQPRHRPHGHPAFVEADQEAYTLTYIPTGQTIQFYGLDDPGKLKSIAVPFGYFGVMHFEEFDQYDGPEEIRNVEQSVFRGGPFSFSFKTFNSPAMARHWVNRYKREAKRSSSGTTPPI